MKNRDHSYFMEKALKQAELALKKGEVPVGAVVVGPKGNILARGHNLVELKGCQTAHAEMSALTKACKKRGNWRLDDCFLYVTLEPCVMCFGFIALSRVKGLVFGAKSPLFGGSQFLGSLEATAVKMGDHVTIIQGLKEVESAAILKLFFKQARQKNKGDI